MDSISIDAPFDAPSFSERFDVLKTIFATRLSNVVRSLKESVGSIPRDEPALVLGDHPDSSAFMGARVEEIVQIALHSEREAFIVKLSEALSTREAELRSLSRISGKAQHAWQQRISQLAEANASLHAQLTEVSARAHDDGVSMQHTSAALAAASEARERAALLSDQVWLAAAIVIAPLTKQLDDPRPYYSPPPSCVSAWRSSIAPKWHARPPRRRLLPSALRAESWRHASRGSCRCDMQHGAGWGCAAGAGRFPRIIMAREHPLPCRRTPRRCVARRVMRGPPLPPLLVSLPLQRRERRRSGRTSQLRMTRSRRSRRRSRRCVLSLRPACLARLLDYCVCTHYPIP